MSATKPSEAVERDGTNHFRPMVEDFFRDYTRLLDDQQYDDWLNLFAEESFYGVIRHVDFVKDNQFFVLGDTKEKLRVRLRLGTETDNNLRVHLLSGVQLDDARADGTILASANFAVFRDNAAIYSGKYRVELSRKASLPLRIVRCVAIIANEQPNHLFFLPI